MITDRVALIVVNFGSSSLIAENFRAFGSGWLVVVIDNFSTDEERERIASVTTEHGWVLVPSANLGYGGGANVGIAEARERGRSVFVVANPDLVLSPRDATALAEAVEAAPDELVGPVIHRRDGRVWFDGASIELEHGIPRTVPGTDVTAATGWLTGACLAVHVDLWDRVDGFDDAFFLYWEDIDLSWRVVEAGGRLRLLADVVVVHGVGGTQVSIGGKSPLYIRFNCRNRLLFAARHLDGGQRSAWARSSWGYARLLLLRAGRRNYLRRPWRRTAAAVRGTVEGLRLLHRQH